MSGLRLAFFLLIFANLVAYAWTQGYLGGNDAGREPQRLASQIAPDRLRIVAAGLPVKPACRVVTGLPPDAAESFKAALAGSGIAVDIKQPEETNSYWVHLPPQPNRATADKKAAELKKLGVTDFYIVQDPGPNRFAISLGLYKSDAAAAEFLKGLTKRGVRSARVEVREKPPQTARLSVQGPVAVVNKHLAELLARLPDARAADCP